MLFRSCANHPAKSVDHLLCTACWGCPQHSVCIRVVNHTMMHGEIKSVVQREIDTESPGLYSISINHTACVLQVHAARPAVESCIGQHLPSCEESERRRTYPVHFQRLEFTNNPISALLVPVCACPSDLALFGGGLVRVEILFDVFGLSYTTHI